MFNLTGFSSDQAQATIYYVSSAGDDLNNGTSPAAPWQTITKVNSFMASINPGDQILFKKGDTFYGTINATKSGTAGNEIVFGSYGSGNLPVITGKKLITGWTTYTGNIYKANFTDTVSHIYVNNKIMTIARYPNTGFLKVDNNNGNTGFYDAALLQSSGYWNGTNCRIRTANWAYETRTVSNFNGGTITFNTGTLYTTGANFGYYLDNKINVLDVENEWFQDKPAGIVYFYAPGGVNPNTINTEAIVARNGIFITPGKNYIIIQDLNLTGFSDMGVNAFTNSNIKVLGCKITQTSSFGISITGSDIIFNNNYFEDNLSNAIFGAITNGEIKNNFINRTGLVPGYGKSGRGYLGLDVYLSNNLTVQDNIIDSTGYSSMFVGNNTIVKNNYINYSLLKLNDGAGIDIGDCDNLQIIDNIILNTIGNSESGANPALYGSGIYVNGALMKNTTISGNTSANNTYSGILLDHKNTPVNNKIIGNTLYNNFNMSIVYTDYSAAVNIPAYNTITKKNIFYCLSANQNCMVQRTYTGSSYNDYGTFDSNYYCNPYSQYTISKTKFPVYVNNIYSLDNWKSTSGKDPNSKASLFAFDQEGITDTIGGNMITNPNFNANINNWASWPAGLTIGWDSNPLLDGGNMRIRWSGVGNSIGLALSSRYAITSGNNYLVSFSCAGNHTGTLSFWGLSSLSSSTFSFPQKFFNYNNVRKDYSFTYTADINDPIAFLSIGLSMPDSLVYVDNINMYRVNVDKIDSTQKSKLFVNENNYVQNISLNGIPYKDLDGNPVSGNLALQPYSSKILINSDYLPTRVLTLRALIEGMYNSGSDKTITDTVTVVLRSSASPYAIVDSCRSKLDTNGYGTFAMPKALNSVNYFIVIKHRNAMETWSGSLGSFNNNQMSYDFTTSANKAYGNNMILKGTRYCLYSGDILKNNQIELDDVVGVFNAANNFTSGYLNVDINGDEIIDLDDINYVYNNASKFIGIMRP